MSADVSREEVERMLQGIGVLPRPSLLGEVDRELEKVEPDLRRTASLNGRDVALSAAVLKTLNSPVFALRSKVANIPQAVMLLGARNTRCVITGLVTINFLAEHIIETSLHQRLDPLWETYAGAVLDYLSISDETYCEIEENALAMFN